MNKTLLLLPVLLFGTASCSQMDCVQGTGQVDQRELMVPPITGVITEGSIDVDLMHGDAQKVIAEGPSAILDIIETKVKNGVWTVRTSQCFNSSKRVVVHVTIPELGSVGVEGSGNIRSTDTFNGKDLDVHIAGSGDISLPVNYQKIKASIAGSGSITLSGTTNTFDVNVAGSGDVHAAELSSADAEVDVAGSGDVDLTAVQSLDVEVAGSGSVRYRGQPKLSTSIEGSGKVVPME
ncbi:MAG: DUF2807 domain-containing protein [Flavobacteriales bacterium]|nr:DUF2807 domain-containing protein [Flavobacteriales bacterium]MCB9167593.1 DUF2807 domain-containing protein [Flavobacteriales bacterium]